jgi:hypothetical protein
MVVIDKIGFCVCRMRPAINATTPLISRVVDSKLANFIICIH